MIKKGFKVKILTGKDKSTEGEVIEIDRQNRRAQVKDINIIKKHIKWRQENYKKHTCKFWRVDGNCRFGDDCKFRHDFDNETLRTVGPTGIFILQRTQKFSVLGVIESASTTNTNS